VVFLDSIKLIFLRFLILFTILVEFKNYCVISE